MNAESSTENEQRLTQEIEKDTTNMEKKENYIPDRVNAPAYEQKLQDENKAQ